MAEEKKSDWWVCFWLCLIAFSLNHIAGDLDKIVNVIEQHTGEP